MYAIEYFVGRKYGTWARGTERYASAEHAARIMARDAAAEHDGDYTIFRRRCVKEPS